MAVFVGLSGRLFCLFLFVFRDFSIREVMIAFSSFFMLLPCVPAAQIYTHAHEFLKREPTQINIYS